MSFFIKLDEHPDIWDNFIRSTPQGSVFLFTSFLQALGCRFQLITCYDGNDIVAGYAIIFDEKGKPIRHNFPFTIYQGIVLADFSNKKPHSRYHYELKLLSFFIQALHEKYQHFFLCQSWQMKDLRAFQWHNYHSPEKGTFKFDLRYTGILDLDIIKDKDFYISKEIRDSNKQDYHKAIKNGVLIDASQNIELLLELYKQTFERQGIITQEKDIQLVRNITEASLKNKFGEVFFAKTKDGEVSNATLFLYDNFCAYYLIGANSPQYRNSGASAMLMIHNIFYAQELGKKYVDFVGINSPQRGEFKLSFNAEPKPYFHLTI